MQMTHLFVKKPCAAIQITGKNTATGICSVAGKNQQHLMKLQLPDKQIFAHNNLWILPCFY